MANDTKPQSIAERAQDARIDAVIEQMYGYFRREDRPRIVWTDLETRRAA